MFHWFTKILTHSGIWLKHMR